MCGHRRRLVSGTVAVSERQRNRKIKTVNDPRDSLQPPRSVPFLSYTANDARIRKEKQKKLWFEWTGMSRRSSFLAQRNQGEMQYHGSVSNIMVPRVIGGTPRSPLG